MSYLPVKVESVPDLSFYSPPCQRNEREQLSLWLSLLGGSLVKRKHSAEKTEKKSTTVTHLLSM